MRKVLRDFPRIEFENPDQIRISFGLQMMKWRPTSTCRQYDTLGSYKFSANTSRLAHVTLSRRRIFRYCWIFRTAIRHSHCVSFPRDVYNSDISYVVGFRVRGSFFVIYYIRSVSFTVCNFHFIFNGGHHQSSWLQKITGFSEWEKLCRAAKCLVFTRT